MGRLAQRTNALQENSGSASCSRLQGMHISQQILLLLLIQGLTESRHFAAADANDLSHAFVVGGQPALGQVFFLENTFQSGPLFSMRGIRLGHWSQYRSYTRRPALCWGLRFNSASDFRRSASQPKRNSSSAAIPTTETADRLIPPALTNSQCRKIFIPRKNRRKCQPGLTNRSRPTYNSRALPWQFRSSAFTKAPRAPTAHACWSTVCGPGGSAKKMPPSMPG